MEQDELERIYDEHALCACSLFRRFSPCEADVRDLLQDWLVRIARNVDPNEAIENERAYVLRIAYRLAVDWSRRRETRNRYHQEAAENFASSEGVAAVNRDGQRFQREVERAIGLLPQEQQVVVQLKLWDELTFAEIAEVTGVPANTVASRYRYGITKLKEELKRWYEELCCG